MRFALPVLMVASTVAFSAPVPVNRAAEQKQLQAHWNELTGYNPLSLAQAVFALMDHPRAVEFLADKALPVEADADRLRAWLKDLNDPDEVVWRAAYERLLYHDPRAGVTTDEQMQLMTTSNGRRLFASVWCGREIHLEPGTTRTTLSRAPVVAPNPPYLYFTMEQHNRGSHSYCLSITPVKDLRPTEWQRAAVAAHILHARDTTAARAAVARLADGAAEALPTRTAAELLKAKPDAGVAAVDAAWNDLGGYDSPTVVRGIFALARSEVVAHLGAKLPAVKASKEQIRGWLKALNDDDPKVWQPAYTKLTYFQPSLAFTPKEQCELMTTDQGRSALFYLGYGYALPPDRIEVSSECQLTGSDEGMSMSYTHATGGQHHQTVRIEPLSDLNPQQWQRARAAVLILERVGTKDAKAVLKQLADGHPDILPTKEAKAALQRLK